jgi:hypothetical protein
MRNAVRYFVPLAQREKPVTLTCSGNVEKRGSSPRQTRWLR